MEKVSLSDDPAVHNSIRSLKQLAQSVALNTSVVRDDPVTRGVVRAKIDALANQFAGLV